MDSIFIGTRIEALSKLEELTNVTKIITTKNSYVDLNRKETIIVNKKNKDQINLDLINNKSTLVFSSGYPFILPKEVIGNKDKIFVNSHPSYLPNYQGRKCIKRAFDNNEIFYGCTLHYMSEKVDNGKIIYQEKINLRNYSLTEIYKYLFSICEVNVVNLGLKKILNI